MKTWILKEVAHIGLVASMERLGNAVGSPFWMCQERREMVFLCAALEQSLVAEIYGMGIVCWEVWSSPTENVRTALLLVPSASAMRRKSKNN
jgi:hypothetical protein